MPEDVQQESFEEFKKSFSYGTRSDLSFKFLAGLSDQDAAKFLQELLWRLGDAFDSGNFAGVETHLVDGQTLAYGGAGKWGYTEGPFTRLRKPLAESRLALLASSGHFVQGDDPEPLGVKNMTQEEATDRIMEFLKSAPTLSRIPTSTPRENLRVRHGGYDIRGALADPNVAFPYQVLRALADEGVIGELAPDAYSFVGACAQTRLLKESAPGWVKTLQEEEIDAALLVPV